ncbi:MAG: PQQ-binding-like beta-propeller repeat protein [Candidatus Saliniplasma sp.]
MVKKITGIGYKMKDAIRFKSILCKVIIILFLFILISSPIYSSELADSPWPCYKNNSKNTGLSTYHTENLTDEIRWEFDTEGFIISSPTLGSDGTIYIGSSDTRLYAIKQNGVLKWSYKTEGQIRSSPAVDDNDNIYFGSRDGYFYSVDNNGELRWRFEDGSRIDSSPIIDTLGNIYFGTEDGILYSISEDGDLNWEFHGADGDILTSPALDENGNIIFGSNDGSVYSVSQDMEINWEFETDGSVGSSPSIDDDGNVYFGSNDGKLYSLSPDGFKRWNYTTENWIDSSPSIGPEGNIYFGSTDSNLYALDKEGELLWEHPSYDIWRSTPVICADGIVYIGDTDGYLYAVHPDGEVKWSLSTQSAFYSSATIASDGVIYVGAMDGKLYSIGRSQEVPGKPKNLDIELDEDSVVISWEEPSYKGMSTDLEYNIYRGTSLDNLTHIASTSELKFSDTKINEEETYYYQITAVNEYGESVPSEPIDVDISEGGGGSALTEIDSTLLIFGSIVLSLITIIGFRITLNRRKKLETDGDLKEDEDEKRYITCPHCGHRTVIEEENNGSLKCSRCKSKI